MTIVLLMPCMLVSAAEQSLVRLVEKQQSVEALAMIESGVDVNMAAADGTTALHWAAYYGELELAVDW